MQGIPLTISTKTNTFFYMIHGVQGIHPVSIHDFEHALAYKADYISFFSKNAVQHRIRVLFDSLSNLLYLLFFSVICLLKGFFDLLVQIFFRQIFGILL